MPPTETNSHTPSDRLPIKMVLSYVLTVVLIFVFYCGEESVMASSDRWDDRLIFGSWWAVAFLHPMLVVQMAMNWPKSEKVSPIGWIVINVVLNTVAFSAVFVFETYPFLVPNLMWTSFGLSPLFIFSVTLLCRVLWQKFGSSNATSSSRIVEKKLTIAKILMLTISIAIVLSTLVMSNPWGQTFFQKYFPSDESTIACFVLGIGVPSILYWGMFAPASWYLRRSPSLWHDRFTLFVLGAVLLLTSSLALYAVYENSLENNLVGDFRTIWIATTVAWALWIFVFAHWPTISTTDTREAAPSKSQWCSRVAFVLALTLSAYFIYWTWDQLSTHPTSAATAPKQNTAGPDEPLSVDFELLSSVRDPLSQHLTRFRAVDSLPPNTSPALSFTELKTDRGSQPIEFTTSQNKAFLEAYLAKSEEFYLNATRQLASEIKNINANQIPLEWSLELMSCGNFLNFSKTQISPTSLTDEFTKISRRIESELTTAPFKTPKIWQKPPQSERTLFQKLKFDLSPKSLRSRQFATFFLKQNRPIFERIRERHKTTKRQVFEAAKQLFQAKEGVKPENWDDLVPEYLSRPITDLETGQPFDFKK